MFRTLVVTPSDANAVIRGSSPRRTVRKRRVELNPGGTLDLPERRLSRHWRLISIRSRHGVERLANVDDPRTERNRVRAEASRDSQCRPVVSW